MKKLTIGVLLASLLLPASTSAEAPAGSNNVAALVMTLENIKQKLMVIREHTGSSTIATSSRPTLEDALKKMRENMERMKILAGSSTPNMKFGSSTPPGWFKDNFPWSGSTTPGVGNRPPRCVALMMQLKRGMAGQDVSNLQEYLATMPEIYPEGSVTGTYGPKTEEAIKRFQSKHGLEQTGALGPMTREKLRRLSCEMPPRQMPMPAPATTSTPTI